MNWTQLRNYDLLPFVCEIMFVFLFVSCIYFYSFTMVLLSFFTEYSIIKLGLDGTALVNAFIPKI